MTTNARFHGWVGLVLLALCGALGALFLAPRKALDVAPRPESETNILRVVYTQPVTLDPHRRTFPVSTYNHLALCLWEPLVECDPVTGTPRPAAAESWTWSADYRRLTIKLRQDAQWSNGDRLDADAFVRGWLRLLRQGMDVAHVLFPVKNAEAYHRGDREHPEKVGVRAIDAFTLEIELEQPRVTFVAELADPLLAPFHESSERVLGSRTLAQSPESLVTNGPFMLSRIEGDTLKLVRSPHYHGREAMSLAGVDFVRTDGVSTGALLVTAGKADLLAPIGREWPGGWPTQRALEIESELALAVVSVYFNTTREPFQDVRVRRALALALNRGQLIAEDGLRRFVEARSWVPDMPGRKGLKLLEENPDEARRLLAEAGYSGGEGFPILRMHLPAWLEGNPHPVLCAEQWFRELGVRTYISYEERSSLGDRMRAGDYDVTFGVVVATVPDAGDLLSTFLMPELYSESKWNDPETRRLLMTANRTVGPERLQWLERAERRAMAEAPVVPLLFERRQTLRASEVEGWYPDPLARQSFKHLRLRAPRIRMPMSPVAQLRP